MKNLSILMLSALLVSGLASCKKEAGTAATDAAVAANGEVPADTNSMRLPAEQAEAEAMQKTTVSFSEVEYDFGTVKEGAKVRHIYKVKNTGSFPLKITQVKPSCGCTASDFTKEEIAPGAEGEISAEFNSAGRPGMANKTINVTGNFADGLVKVLRLKGEVK